MGNGLRAYDIEYIPSLPGMPSCEPQIFFIQSMLSHDLTAVHSLGRIAYGSWGTWITAITPKVKAILKHLAFITGFSLLPQWLLCSVPVKVKYMIILFSLTGWVIL